MQNKFHELISEVEKEVCKELGCRALELNPNYKKEIENKG